MYMRRLRHVHRPGIAVTVPTFSGPIVLDVGANIEPKPHHLAQYGVMGSIYASRSMGDPRSASDVGGEEAKGTAEMKFARDMLRDAENTNFIGYVEGRGVFDGEADVVVTDGVVGNVMIKLAEGLSAGIFKAIASEVFEIDPELAMRFEPVVKSLYAKHDYHEYGGAPLLGVNGVCMIAHGSAVGRTITNAILRGREFVRSGVNEAISEALATVGQVAEPSGRKSVEDSDAPGAQRPGRWHRFLVPEEVLTNDDLARMMDTSDEWIRQRTGIDVDTSAIPRRKARSSCRGRPCDAPSPTPRSRRRPSTW